MKEVTILTPYGGDGTEKSPYGPLVADKLGYFPWADVTARPMGKGKPMRNLYAIRAKLTDDQIKAVRQDSRFFITVKEDAKQADSKQLEGQIVRQRGTVKEPDVSFKAADADLWLKNRGFTDHPVKLDDSEPQAIEKLRGYFKGL